MDKSYECCFCNETNTGFGNNPAPYGGDKCCDPCNSKVVLPCRFLLMKQQMRSEEPLTEKQEREIMYTVLRHTLGL